MIHLTSGHWLLLLSSCRMFVWTIWSNAGCRVTEDAMMMRIWTFAVQLSLQLDGQLFALHFKQGHAVHHTASGPSIRRSSSQVGSVSRALCGRTEGGEAGRASGEPHTNKKMGQQNKEYLNSIMLTKVTSSIRICAGEIFHFMCTRTQPETVRTSILTQ